MGFSEKTPEYKACIQFIQAISPKHKTNVTVEVIDLTSPAEADDEKIDNNDIFFENAKNIKDPKQDEQLNNEEEHGVVDDITDNSMGEQKGEIWITPAKQFYGDLKTQIKLYHFSRGGGMSSGIDR